MSTTDRNVPRNLPDDPFRSSERKAAEAVEAETGQGQPRPENFALPDVATLTDLANLFFRALPVQTSNSHNVSSPSLPGLGSAQSAPPAIGAFASHAPQFGAPLPSVPSLPSLDKIPNEVDILRLAGPSTEFPRELDAFMSTPSLFPTGLPLPAVSSPTPQPFTFRQTASPFSLPLPGFEFPFSNFQTSVPGIPALPVLADDDSAKSLRTAGSSFYFLEHAGTLTKPLVGTTVSEPARRHFEPALVPQFAPVRRQFDVASIRRDFPILQEQVNGHRLVWLDNAATTQKPRAVIDRVSYFYEHENSNIHRAAHELAARATDAYEDARQKVAHFLNAPSAKEIVFVRGATEAINLVAQSWGRRHIGKDDEIVISWMEHHANIVPWQMLCAEKGAKLRVIPIDDHGQILLDEYEKLLNPRTRLVSFTQVSNALGSITPAQTMVQMAHRYGARVLLDGAQAVSHMRIDVQQLDCDFFVFSGHKVFAPTGIGVLYGKPDVLADSPPWQGGGNMIVDVTFEKTVYQAPPLRFEAGTGNIADAVGLGAAIDYLDQIGMENIARHEHDLLVYATRAMLQVPGLCIIGTAREKAGVISFVLEGHTTEDVGAALNREGIAVRSGHHCAQPTLRRFGHETAVRPSLALYNGYDDIDALVAALHKLKQS